MNKNERTIVTSRRSFLKTSGVVAAAFAVPQVSVIPASAQGANDRIGVGFIGTGGRCGAHINTINQYKEQGVTQPVAVCDVYRPRLEAASRATGDAKMYMAHEELLQDKNVDLVCIASPDAHHAPQTIDALNAGKDVFCEKPLTHWNQFGLAKKMQEAADKNKRLVQVGTQYMADDNYAKVRQMIKDGVIGKPVHAQCGYFRRGDWGERMHIPDPNAKPGPDLDWNRFLGDSPKVEFSVERFFQWRLWWDYAGGPSTDLLVHTYTPAFCILGLDFPERVFGGGGTFQYNREVPDQCNIIADYKDGPSVVMLNSLSHHTGIDTLIRGTEGVILWKHIEQANSPGIRIVPNQGDEIVLPWSGMGDVGRLWKNLLDCVKTREQPYCSIDLAVKVQAPLSMGIISHRESKVVKFDFDKRDFVLS
ncbi:MAG: Gfo/Idh/MocA family oxidoreductase [Planctomycetaceae bacterium]|nr:Gfo/Idh/MocA family oxidoreductase [Planctomycetaceae bacterium]